MPGLNRKTLVERYSATGSVININATHVFLEAAGSIALTLPDPPADASWNGHQMEIKCTTAQAHTITNTTGFNGGGGGADELLLDAITEAATIVAFNGKWWTLNLQGAGIS